MTRVTLPVIFMVLLYLVNYILSSQSVGNFCPVVLWVGAADDGEEVFLLSPKND